MNRCLAALIGGFMAFCVSAAPALEPASDDPYRHFEDAADPRTQEFLRDQAARARVILDGIPGRAEMLGRVRAHSEAGTIVTQLHVTPARVFYLKQPPGAGPAVICMREGIAGAERVLLDPSRYDQGGARAAVDWLVPSPDGRHVAFGVSLAASGESVLRVVTVEGARVLPFEIDRARFNASLAWHPDSRSFYYARIPEANAGPRRFANIRIYRHVLGRDTARDEIVLAPGIGGARDVPEFAFPSLHIPADSRHAYAVVRDGVRREIALHVARLDELAAGRPRWHKLAAHEDEVIAIEAWRDDAYLLSKKGAPRHRVLRVKAAAPNLGAARVVVPQGEAVIEDFGLARDAIYLRSSVGGVERLERVGLGLLGAKAPEYVRTPFDHAISQLLTHPRMPGAMLRMQGWIEPPVVVQVEAGSGNLRRTPIQPAAAMDLSDMDEVRLYAPSPDGARIPVTLVYRKTTRLDRQNPTLLSVFGSYGVSMRPSFDPARLAWLERGGVFAIAHVRGGGEYGEEWHRAGRGTAKVNSVLDLITVSQFLVNYGFTSPAQLAVEATGAGAIAAAGAIVRRPELYAALVARAPLVDMLRYERLPIGAANVAEFGSISTAAGADALRAISAYHQVREGVAYPAALLITAPNDPDVEPWQAAKMAARLQAARKGERPVLLRSQPADGSRAERGAELADIYAFLLWQMGDPRFQPPAPPPPPREAPERTDE